MTCKAFAFTYEEMHFFLSQKEAIINSRPNTTILSDPNDFNAPTRAHFLIEELFVTCGESHIISAHVGKLAHYQITQNMLTYF